MKYIRLPMLKTTTLLLVLVMAGGAFFTFDQAKAQSTDDKISLFASALRAKQQGDLQEAKRLLEDLLRLDPRDRDVQQMLAQVNNQLAATSGSPSTVRGSTIRVTGRSSDAIAYPSAQDSVAPASPSAPAPVPSARSAQPAPSSPDELPLARTFPIDGPVPDDVSSGSGGYVRVVDRRNEGVSGTASTMGATTAEPTTIEDYLLRESGQQADDAERLKAVSAEVSALIEDGDYADARAVADSALSSTAPTKKTEKTYAKLATMRHESLLIESREAAEAGNLSAAKELIGQYEDAVGGEDEASMQAYRDAIKAIGSPNSVNIDDVATEYINTQEEVAQTLAEGRALLLAGDLEGAQQRFGLVEGIDPNNVEAKYFQQRIAEKRYENALLNRQKTREQMLWETQENWSRPQNFFITTGDGPVQTDSILSQKLEQITIPRVQFNGVPLSRVVDTLSEFSVEFDNTEMDDDGRRGANIIVIDPTGADPIVNISLRNLTLGRILDFISEQTGYEVTVEEDVVVLRPGTGEQGLETEFVPIKQSLIIRLTGGCGAGGGAGGGGGGAADPFADPFGGGGGGGGGFGGAAGGGGDECEEQLKSFFERAGIPFSTVPNANLAIADGQLIITNSQNNNQKVQNLLRRYTDIKQVEIETKFLEVRQSDLEEVGFNWSIVDDNYSLTTQNRSLDGTFSNSAVVNNISVSTATGTTLIPAGAPVIPTGAELASDAGDFVTVSGGLGIGTVDMMVRALSRKEGSDLMSAPRVTVLSDRTANIRVAQELIYPTSYGDIESQTSTSGGGGLTGGGSASVSITAGTPQDFEMRPVGVELDVTPKVESDDSINLILEPRVTEFEGFVEYGGPSVAIAGSTAVTVPSGFFQPIFTVRSVTTEVTIWDGATVVLGGLTREQVLTVKDKVPVLGDIPLLGRAFRSEGEVSEKRNLLIFVTANLISPGGAPAKQKVGQLETGTIFNNPTITTPAGIVNRRNAADE